MSKADSTMDALNCSEEGNSSKDKLFDPSIDMLVNDFDDEQTLEEEEALAAGEDTAEEIDSLQKEGDMPLEELLALYGYGNKTEETAENEEVEPPVEEPEEEPEVPEPEPSQLQVLYEPIAENEQEQDASRLLRSVSRFSEEEEEDYDYLPSESDYRNKSKAIMVGNDYQAVIPEGLRR